jgi:outer membrane protein OmpA-like peptidoglycan-associated protein
MLCLAFQFLSTLSFAQVKESPIELTNPSFEGVPSAGAPPAGWFDCGRKDESPPDIQPGSFDVATLPRHGDSYLGMVVRDNDTWESVGQRIRAPLQKDHCYDFAIDMCRSETYVSPSRKTSEKAHYTSAVKVLIWGGNDYCEKRELLGESSMVTNPRWLTYTFRLNPKKGSYSYIMFEAYYQTPVLFPYNGNVLIDNATIIDAVNCSAKLEIPPVKPNTSIASTGTKTKANPVKNGGTTSKPTPPITNSTPPAGNQQLAKAKKGETIRLERIIFKADSYELQPDSEPSLQEVFTFLKDNPDVTVEVGGHTNGIPPDAFCDELSTNRAKNVANWLIQQGIAPNRVQYKGYGKRKPLASNGTKEGRAQNQRVEVKILSRNG